MGKLKPLLWVTILSLALILVPAVSAVSPAAEPQMGGTAIVIRGGSTEILDPGYSESGDDVEIDYHVYENLVRYKSGSIEVEPALAESWEVSEDGKTWTFHLREGVKFHDGTDFNAEAVVFSFKRLYDEEHPYYMVGGSWSYFDYLLGDEVEDVVAVDDYTVELRLKDKYAPLLTVLGYYSEAIISPAAMEKWGEDFMLHPTGTGSYKLEEWKDGEYVSIVRNEDYWGEQPYLDKIIWKEVPEASTRLLEMKNGHVMSPIMPEQISMIEENPDWAIIRIPGANLSWLHMRQKYPPLDDVRVRWAFNYAIDVEAIVEGLWGGTGVPAINPYPSTMFGWNPDVEPYGYDPDKAVELLAEAGWTDTDGDGIVDKDGEPFEMEISTMDIPRPYLPHPREVCEAIAGYMEAVGVKLTVREYDMGTFSELNGNHELPLTVIGWYDIPEPNQFMNGMLLIAAYSSSPYENQEMYELAEKALRTYDTEERAKYYMQMQEIFHEEAPKVPLAHSEYLIAASNEIEGVELAIDGSILLLRAYFPQ